ncbi:fibrocystin-L [Pelobates cultripes]|uniref:Fibrocystin-L n=1 Tax=Pelobates cultripes TaxID=61616 RepID=A0AAD1S1G0_PELCU|nr:fibrocystin-L [Pelobates cultripes]
MNQLLLISIAFLVIYEKPMVFGLSSNVGSNSEIGTEITLDETEKKTVHRRSVDGTSTSFNTYVSWSNETFWNSSAENNNTVPKAGSNVVIPSGIYVTADIALPSLNTLTIYGALELKPLTNTEKNGAVTSIPTILSATYIYIQGGLLMAGNESDPFLAELKIILRGNQSSPNMSLPSGNNIGSKFIGVFGQLQLHGLPRSVYKTKLAQTAVAGSTNISLSDPVDWKVGEYILITTTSYNASQSEIRQISGISDDHKNLTLNASLTFTHIGETYRIDNTTTNYTLAADVAVLSRNIQIIGENYNESFGARVLVGAFTNNNITYKGSAKIENVEFYHSGQKSFTDPSDPRYYVTFLNLGVVPENSSYVRGCSLHDGFSPAIGVFNTSGLNIDDNVIYFTVGEGIRIWGQRIKVRRNLVSLSVWPGSYQGKEQPNNTIWNAAIEINNGIDIVLQNNIVAGFERVGYRINGEPCPDANNTNIEWLNNEAHGGLYGVYMNNDGLSGCSQVRRFLVWKCWDYGIYTQTADSVVISNVVLVDNGMGILPIVFGPPASSHQTSKKTITIQNSVLVGSSPSFNCNDTLNVTESNMKLSAQHRSPRPPAGGRSGISWPTFASTHNGAPGNPHAGITSYNAISGLMTVTDTIFAEYRNVCSVESNVIFMTNPLNEDLQHPVMVFQIQTVNCAEDQKVFIHRPDPSKATPSGCVDMVCDAKRKALLKDLDGTFLGSIGSVIPQSEYQWNGLASYGLGDSRIPKVMLTNLNGSSINVSQVAPYQGIIRDPSCAYVPTWESYKCTGLNYEILVIESLDPDTETRRLSPVAVLGDGYIDIISGPQNHTSCNGSNCEKKRVSLFHSIVATNKSFDIYFSTASPQNLRLMLLNCASTKSVRVGIFFPNPQRLDVYVNGIYVYPTNANMTNNGTSFTLNTPTYEGQYLPQLTSNVSGDNFLDETYKMFYTVVKGSTPIQIYTSPLIAVTFKLPAMAVNQFKSDDFLNKLATFLKISSSKLRVKKIVEDGSRRRKRATGGLTVQVEIADPPSTQRTDTSTTGGLTFSNFTTMSQTLAAALINGSLSSQLNVTVSSISVSTPIPSSSDPSWSQVASQNVSRTPSSSGSFLNTVSTLVVIVQPVAGKSGQPFTQQPSLMAQDSNGNCVDVSVSAMSLTANLKYSNNTYATAGLSGNTTISFTSCWANYTNLVLNLPGKGYMLEFVLNNVHAQTRSFDTTDSSTTTTSGSESLTIQSSFHLFIALVLCLLTINGFLDIVS